jgi:hypothetical protein
VANPFLAAVDVVRDAAARHGFRVALIGGFALPFHGIRRATGDVDFLVDEAGREPLHDALVAAGYETLHRSADAANYRATDPVHVGVDVLYARRPATRAMLARARVVGGPSGVAIVDVEGLIGLKLQALVNDPRRRRQDEADIVALLRLHLDALDLPLLEEYFALFERGDDLARFLAEARQARG